MYYPYTREGAIQPGVQERVLCSSKKLLPVQGEGGDGGGVSDCSRATMFAPTPILTFPLKGKGLSIGVIQPLRRHQFESHPRADTRRFI